MRKPIRSRRAAIITTIAVAFSAGAFALGTSASATDLSVVVVEGPTEIALPTVGDFTVIDPCGVDLDGWIDPTVTTGFTIGNPDLSEWPTVLNVVIPLTADEGYIFIGGLTETTVNVPFTDLPCDEEDDPPVGGNKPTNG